MDDRYSPIRMSITTKANAKGIGVSVDTIVADNPYSLGLLLDDLYKGLRQEVLAECQTPEYG